MIKGTQIFIICSLFIFMHAELVIDLAGSFNDYQCFRDVGVSQVIVRAFHSYGSIDLEAKNNIFKANSVGIATDVYMFPCRGKNATTQANDLITYLQGMKDDSSAFAYTTGTIWLDIETNPSPTCSWNQGTFDTNCQFVKQLVDALQAKGRAVGIYASHYMWLQIFGAVDRCNLFTDLPIWYAHYDRTQNFDDWEINNKFGGWKVPTLKQYAGGSSLCGMNVDLSWY